MNTRELTSLAILLVAAVALFCSMMGWLSRDIGIISSAICIAVPALMGYLQMRSADKVKKES